LSVVHATDGGALGKAIPKKKGRPQGSRNKKRSLTSNPDNHSGIIPFQFKVLILPDEIKKKTKGGILLPDEAVDLESRGQILGTIIELSPAAFSYHDWPDWVVFPKAGDRVYFARHSGSTVRGKDGVDYRMVNDKDIGAIIDF
jgi:co-chaperonin GroES (HSP10)